jgi:hypothetical protein
MSEPLILEPKVTKTGRAYFTCHPCSLDVMVPGVSIENMMQESMNMKLGAAAGDHLKNHKES